MTLTYIAPIGSANSYLKGLILDLKFDGSYQNDGISGQVPATPALSSVQTGELTYGGGNVSFPASYDYTLTNKDFTLEFWVLSLGREGALFAADGWNINFGNNYYNNGSWLSFGYQNSSHWGGNGPGWGMIELGVWHHYTLCRKAGYLYTFLDGAPTGSVTYIGNSNLGGTAASTFTVISSVYYVDNVRLTIGTPEHDRTDSFLVSPRVTPVLTGTVIDMKLNGSFQNDGITTKTPASTGQFIADSLFNMAGSGSSLKNGTGTVVFPHSYDYTLSTTDFTLEFSAFITNMAAGETVVISSAPRGASGWKISLGNSTVGTEGSRVVIDGTVGPTFGIIPVQCWNNFTLCRKQTKLYTYLNGAPVASYTIGTGKLALAVADSLVLNNTNAMLSNVKMTVGNALYNEGQAFSKAPKRIVWPSGWTDVRLCHYGTAGGPIPANLGFAIDESVYNLTTAALNVYATASSIPKDGNWYYYEAANFSGLGTNSYISYGVQTTAGANAGTLQSSSRFLHSAARGMAFRWYNNRFYRVTVSPAGALSAAVDLGTSYVMLYPGVTTATVKYSSTTLLLNKWRHQFNPEISSAGAGAIYQAPTYTLLP